MQLRR